MYRTSAVKSADLVQVYHKIDDQKRGIWLSSHTVFNYDIESGIVSVPSSCSRPMLITREDLRVAVADYDIAIHVLETSDPIHSILDEIVDATATDDVSEANRNENTTQVKCFDLDEELISHDSAV